jgi:hypothetical protein
MSERSNFSYLTVALVLLVVSVFTISTSIHAFPMSKA